MISRSIRIGFAGDLCLKGLERASDEDIRMMRESISSLTTQADLTMVNLECCITENDPRRPVPKMSAPERNLELISGIGIDVLCLANNHILDDGPRTLERTQVKLGEFGFHTCGVGRSRAEASEPLIVHRSGLSIGVVNATDATHYAARRGSPGVNRLARGLLEETRMLKQRADIVVVVLHSDLEFINTPSPWRVRLSRRLAARGADLVIHHHPHTLQGLEHHNGSLIAYSLGNFVFPVAGAEYMAGRIGNVDQGLFLIADITIEDDDRRTVRPIPIPTCIDALNRLRICSGATRAASLENLERYSRLIESNRELRARYFARCLEEARRFGLGILYRLAELRFRETILYVRGHLGTQMQRNWMRGLLTLGLR